MLKEVCNDGTRGSDFNLGKGGFVGDIRKKFVPARVVGHWSSCPEKLWVPHPWKHSRPGPTSNLIAVRGRCGTR